jgi:fructokinase
LYGDEDGIAEGLLDKYGLRLLALTRGEKGSVLYTRDEVSEHPGIPAEVRDSVGAGDSFAAAVLDGILRGRTLDDINDRGNIIASYVCSQDGATPEVPEEVIGNQ